MRLAYFILISLIFATILGGKLWHFPEGGKFLIEEGKRTSLFED